MISDYIALFPDFMLILGIAVMALVRLMRKSNTPKTFYTLSRIFMIASALGTALFYNQNIGGFWYNNSFTTLFKLLIYLFAFIWNYLSLKRFSSKDMPSFAFYELILLNILGFSVAISSHNLLLLFAGLAPVFLSNCFLLRIERHYVKSRWFWGISLLFMAVFAAGVMILGHFASSFDYGDIERMLGIRSEIIWQYNLAFAFIVCAILFMAGIAPFHFWRAEALGEAILPVAGFLSIIPLFAYFACLVNVCVNAFYPLLGWMNPVLIDFGIISVFIGAVGANSENDLRRIFAYSGQYYTGVVLLVLFPINDHGLMASFTYLLVYITAICGIYTVLFALRSKGVYLSKLDDLKGVAAQRPFLSAALLVFMISLIGTPPMLGFLGKLAAINTLVIEHRFVIIGVIMAAQLILVYAYLKIITVVYFEPRSTDFDKVDRGIYACLLAGMILILIAIINPKYLLHDVEQILVTVL